MVHGSHRVRLHLGWRCVRWALVSPHPSPRGLGIPPRSPSLTSWGLLLGLRLDCVGRKILPRPLHLRLLYGFAAGSGVALALDGVLSGSPLGRLADTRLFTLVGHQYLLVQAIRPWCLLAQACLLASFGGNDRPVVFCWWEL
jgi:hypothetical protein